MQKQESNGFNKASQVVVVMVPFPAQGHLNQLLQLSRLILSYRVIPVHYVGTATHNCQAKLRVHGWDSLPRAATIHFHDLHMPPLVCPSPDPNALNKFPSHLQPLFNALSLHLREPFTKLLRALSSTARRVIVVHDSLMGSVIQDVALIPNAEPYTFRSVSAFACFLYIREALEKSVELNHATAVIPKDIPSLEGCFTAEFFDFVAYQYEYQKYNHGNLYNTCRVIEGPYMDLLEGETKWGNNKHWALGPFNPVQIAEKKGSYTQHFALEWLDKQPSNSVVYVSFGTTTTMSDVQIEELATGLKQSEQKFIWVLRDADKGDVFNGEVRRAKLPKGYEDSMKDMGLVVRDWAPQLEILAHPATGGFVTHCGWNSCMESISMGVPIGAWPMHSDQPRNSVLLTKLLKVGIVIKEWERQDDIVTAAKIGSAVRRLMASEEGDEMRKRAAELRDAVQQAVGEGGVSRLELDSFIAHITR